MAEHGYITGAISGEPSGDYYVLNQSGDLTNTAALSWLYHGGAWKPVVVDKVFLRGPLSGPLTLTLKNGAGTAVSTIIIDDTKVEGFSIDLSPGVLIPGGGLRWPSDGEEANIGMVYRVLY